MKLALAQINVWTGDLFANLGLVQGTYVRAVSEGADLVVFPELAITGYPPEDLLLKPDFVRASIEAVELFAKSTSVPAIIGSPYMDEDWSRPFNAAAICVNGEIVNWYFKEHLPNYAVFDEARYFLSGHHVVGAQTFMVGNVKVGVSICEDAWVNPRPPILQARCGADLLVNLSASPFSTQRFDARHRVVGDICRETHVPMAYCNLVGGQDELVFDGASFVCNADGSVIARAKQFAEDLLIVNLNAPEKRMRREKISVGPWETYRALVLGTKDYVQKNGFEHVVLGLSGGIDSALVAAIAVEALGPDSVTGVLMPSRFSSPGSVADARRLASNLGIDTFTFHLEQIHKAYDTTLAPLFGDTEPGIAEENIQARIRGNLIMALANKNDWMALTTGNKSEMAMGYATLYGDMAGGFAVIKDVPKTDVFEICRLLNSDKGYAYIPQQIIDKPPSAELRPDQQDTDSLPPYDVLDPIIEMYVEQDRSVQEIIAAGYDELVVWLVASAIDRNEYKRRQAPPGVRVTTKAFGKDRRLPITNGWSG